MRKEIFQQINKELTEIQKNISLKDYTTLKIGGPAKYFYVAKTRESLIKAIQIAKKLRLPFFILGRGSNLVVNDQGFNGLVIKLQMADRELKNNEISAEAGTLLSQLTQLAFENSLTGLEWASGIPGTAGGAIRGNAGAFGESIADVVKSVEVYNLKNERTQTFNNAQCQFGYRESVFKKKPDLIILSAKFRLQKENQDKIKEKMKEFLGKRKEKQPLGFPSAGSIFKNPTRFLAGELIEKCGLKGKQIGNIKISEKHTNFIVNLGEGKAADVVKLIELIKAKVEDKFNIQLEEEIQYLGF